MVERPQFRWWVWNETTPNSMPTLFHVPYVNLQAFTVALPFAMALVTLWVLKAGHDVLGVAQGPQDGDGVPARMAGAVPS